jgi:Protein of unknown function (DUF2934)
MAEESRSDREDIERRAYRRFEERGRAHGEDQADWFEAEREAREQVQRSGDLDSRVTSITERTNKPPAS